MGMELFRIMMQLHDLLLAGSNDLVELSNVPSKTILLHADLLPPKSQYHDSNCGTPDHQFSTLGKRTKVPRPPSLSNLSHLYIAKMHFCDFQ